MVDNNEGLKTFAKSIQSNLFATKESVEDAMKDFFDAVRTDPRAIVTAQVLLNTIAAHIENNFVAKEEGDE